MFSLFPGLSAFFHLCILPFLLPVLSASCPPCFLSFLLPVLPDYCPPFFLSSLLPVLPASYPFCFLSCLLPALSASCPLYFLFSVSQSLFPIFSVTCPPASWICFLRSLLLSICFLPSLLPAFSASCPLTYLFFLFPVPSLPVLSASWLPRCEGEVSHSSCYSWELLLPPCLFYQEELHP